ncbi:MAG: hypothetical protein PHQ28_00180 [Mycobacterium sp.]|nr:hypothetical protein [Mycobacterium sp.]
MASEANVDDDSCVCEHYVVDYSDPERYHPENIDREENPACRIHAQQEGGSKFPKKSTYQ